MKHHNYQLTGAAMNDLHARSHEKSQKLVPEGQPLSRVKVSNRELAALWESPAVYALLIADEVIKDLRMAGFTAYLGGAWKNIYYAYLMDLTEEDPIAAGLSSKALTRKGYIDAPLHICIPREAEQLCREKLQAYAAAWGFWLYPICSYLLLLNQGADYTGEGAYMAPKLTIDLAEQAETA